MLRENVLTAKQESTTQIVSISTQGDSAEQLISREFLLTNTRGGYCSSTIVGCNTRRYHGLLIAALAPPADRILGLSNLLEMVVRDGRMFNLSTFEFEEKFNPAGYEYIKRFTRDTGAHFEYALEGIELVKSVYLMRNDDTVLVQYDFRKVDGPVEFIIRPFIALRNFHSLQKSYAPLCSYELENCLFVCHDVPGSCELLISCPGAVFEKDPQWWLNFAYRKDKQRGQEFLEDLWTAGFYKCQVDGPGKILFKANVGRHCDSEKLNNVRIEQVVAELDRAGKTIIAGAKTHDETIRKLALAADQFICSRNSNGKSRTTLLAGYPWFFDWGRDAFISLPGLLLCTGRFNEAHSVLTTFAAAADEGMIPNRFDDRSNTAYFNSIDASLWFINAAFQYLKVVGDGRSFNEDLLPVIEQIIDFYQNGTRFGIGADSDGLITGGSFDMQLTWMDAMFDGTAFTPRFGKAVEVNALWYNALCWLAKFYATWNLEKAGRFDSLAEEVEQSFRSVFWNEQTGYLNDCVSPDGTADTSCRCNQIYAVSLEFSPITDQQQSRVVDVVQQKLLTPFGLRTLSPDDSKYKGSCTGNQFQRDASYHQGTVWPYTIGPFVQAYLKVNDFSSDSKKTARGFVEPLINHLTKQCCLGSISEIFDAEPPHASQGCIAQAWSIAELIRAVMLIDS